MPPTRWLQLTVSIPEVGASVAPDAVVPEAVVPEAVAPEAVVPEAVVPGLIPSLLVELGGLGVEEAEGEFVTYFLPPEDGERFLAEACRFLREQSGSPNIELSWAWQPHEEWEVLWREGLGVRRVTDRITVVPSWEPLPTTEGEVFLTLDPGMAFGTAEHPTTRGCLRLLDPRVREGCRIVDVGAGSGILSIAAGLLGASEVLALEMDPLACEVARENSLANNVSERVRVAQEIVMKGGPVSGHPYDGLVANLQSSLLIPLFSTFRASLTPGGWLIVSGVLLEEREKVLADALEEGFFLEEEDQEEIWWSGAFRMRRIPRIESPDKPAHPPG